MNTRYRHPQPQPGSNWSRQSIAPSLAVTSDWWNRYNRLQAISECFFQEARPTPQDQSRPDATASAPPRCPECGAIVYSRRHPVCGVCARPLPQETMFSEAESLRLQQIVEVDRQRHRQWLARNNR